MMYLFDCGRAFQLERAPNQSVLRSLTWLPAGRGFERENSIFSALDGASWGLEGFSKPRYLQLTLIT